MYYNIHVCMHVLRLVIVQESPSSFTAIHKAFAPQSNCYVAGATMVTAHVLDYIVCILHNGSTIPWLWRQVDRHYCQIIMATITQEQLLSILF